MKLRLSLMAEYIIGAVLIAGVLLFLRIGTAGLDNVFGIIRFIFSVPFVMFLPGYNFHMILFPGKDQIDELERIAISIGFSLAVIPVVAFVLDYTRIGLGIWTIFWAELLLIVVLSALAYWRRTSLAAEDRFFWSFEFEFRPLWDQQDRVNRIALVLGIAALILAVVGVIGIIVAPSPADSFTEFYILNAQGIAADYPINAAIHAPITLQVGIVNHETATNNYQVKVSLNNQIIGQSTLLTLARGQKSEFSFTFTIDQAGTKLPVKILLFKQGQAAAYRTLQLLITTDTTRSTG